VAVVAVCPYLRPHHDSGLVVKRLGAQLGQAGAVGPAQEPARTSRTGRRDGAEPAVVEDAVRAASAVRTTASHRRGRGPSTAA